MERHNKVRELSALRKQVVPQGPYNVTPYFLESAEGAVLHTIDGRDLIDFAGGIGVMNVGYGHQKVVSAIKDQAEKYTHSCFHVLMYESYVRLAEKLCDLVPGAFPKMAMFVNSGAEAVENAVKIARYFTKRPAVVCFEHAFHGRTLLTMTLTSKVKPYKMGFGPFAPEVYRLPYAYCYRCTFGLEYPSCEIACADYLKEFFMSHVPAESVAAVLAEPIIGEGGFITPPKEYFPKLAAICRENGIVFVADEVQTGIGRTGKMFAMEHWKVEADLVTSAKSLAAGMPLGALVGKKEIMDAPLGGYVGSTFGGNPISCRAALAVLDIFAEDNLLEKAEKIGVQLRERFEAWQKEFELVGDVRGMGAMIALELVKDRVTKEPAAEEAGKLVKFCYEKGLVLLSCGNFSNVIRILVPLVIKHEEVEKGLSIMEDGLRSISQ